MLTTETGPTNDLREYLRQVAALAIDAAASPKSTEVVAGAVILAGSGRRLLDLAEAAKG
jgi:hypothetical protein